MTARPSLPRPALLAEGTQRPCRPHQGLRSGAAQCLGQEEEDGVALSSKETRRARPLCGWGSRSPAGGRGRWAPRRPGQGLVSRPRRFPLRGVIPGPRFQAGCCGSLNLGLGVQRACSRETAKLGSRPCLQASAPSWTHHHGNTLQCYRLSPGAADRRVLASDMPSQGFRAGSALTSHHGPLVLSPRNRN